MAEEQGKRKRGRRRRAGEIGQRREVPQQEPQQPDEAPELEITEQSDVPGVTGPRFSLRRRRHALGKEAATEGAKSAERARSGPTPTSTSPMDFWRSGQARTYRDPGVARKSMSLRKRITSFYFPPWVPVVGIIAVVFGILGLLFYTRSAIGSPRIGEHWHAAYAIFIGDQRQPNIPTFTGPEEVHTHGDGVIHMHPFVPAGEGSGAAVGRFFQYGSGKLTSDELHVPGQRETYKSGDLIPGTETPGVIRILRADSGIHPLGSGSLAIAPCDAKLESEFEVVNSRYIPKDGDCIRIIFGPPGVQVVVEADRTVISPDDATRTIELSVTGSGASTAFSPAALEVKANEVVKVVLSNDSEPELVNGQPTGLPFHGVRFSGADKQYGTSDDFVVEPATLHPGEQGTAVIRFETAGEFEFRDEAATEGVTPVTGKITVEAVATATPTPTPGPEEVGVTLDVALSDNSFEPKELTVEAGKKFRINLSNGGSHIHNLRIDGGDGAYGAASSPGDDLVSDDVNGGATGELVGQVDKPGVYKFRCDFHRTEHIGTLTVE